MDDQPAFGYTAGMQNANPSGAGVRRLELVGQADAGLAPDQLRDALEQVLKALLAAGGSSAHLRSMVWTAPAPGRFHPSRPEIDLAYRDIFSGMRPPVTLLPGDGPLTIVAVAEIPLEPPPATPVWHDWGVADVARQMTPRNQVPSIRAVLDHDRLRAAEFRTLHADAAWDIAYGTGPKETVDVLYPSGVARPPLWIFIHGGYWQATDKSYVWHRAAAMLRNGYAVAMPNYGLCPTVTLSQIAEQVRACIHFLHRDADALGVDAGRFHVAGKSAGAHLSAWVVTQPDLAFIRSSLVVSGILDLEPVSLLPMGRTCGVTSREQVDSLSPLRLALNPGTRVGIAVGTLESTEFRRQAAELAQRWGGSLLELEGRHHFNADDDLHHGGVLLDLALGLVRGH